MWMVESATPMTWTDGRKRYLMNRGPAPDSQLQPIRAQPERMPDPPDEVDHQLHMMLAMDAALVRMLQAKERQEQKVAP